MDEEGNQILTNQEQEIMTEKLEPYMDDIITFFDDKMTGGALIDSKASKIGSDIQAQLGKSSELSGLSTDFLKKKLDHITHSNRISMDDVFLKVINKLESIDSHHSTTNRIWNSNWNIWPIRNSSTSYRRSIIES